MKFELEIFNRNVTDEQLLQDLVAASSKLKDQGKWLTTRSYKENGKYSADTAIASLPGLASFVKVDYPMTNMVDSHS